MALSDTFTPHLFYFQIQQGQHFHLEFPTFVDLDTGLPFNFIADDAGTWTGRMEVRTQDGALICQFASSGEDGSITFGEFGDVAVDLNAEFTDVLEPTELTSAPLLADLVLVDPIDDEPWCFLTGKGTIRKKVTD